MKQNYLVPPARFGALLAKQRREAGIQLSTIANSSGTRFTLKDLEHIEQGKAVLTDTFLQAITDLYEIHTSTIVPQRNSLIVDLVDQSLHVGNQNIAFHDTSVDAILERYVALLYLLRDQKPGTPVTLRNPDILALEQALGLPPSQIKSTIAEIVPGQAIKDRTNFLSKKLIVPGAGILVSLTAVGSLVFLNGDNTSEILSTPKERPEILIEAPRILKEDASSLSTTTSQSEPTPTTISTLQPTTSATFRFIPPTEPTSTTIQRKVATYAERGAEAEKLITYDFHQKLPGWTITYLGDRQGYRGLTNVPNKTIEIYIDDVDSPFSIAGVLAHEIGHAIDVTYFDNDTRSQWLKARGLPSIWWPGNGLSDFHVGAGDFAEAVAVLISDSPSDSDHGDFTQEQLDLARRLLP